MKSTLFYSASVFAALVAMGSAGPAAAQATGAAAAPANQPHSIDELVVTAQRREQNLQDVPIVVTTVNAQQLQDAGVRDIKDLTIVTPGLTVTTTSNSAITSARIRGVGTVGDNVGLESSVGVIIDEVFRPRNGVAFSDLGELERIEVLKGPQGTLFGKNTTAGVINVITKRPSFTFGATSEATVGDFNQFGASTSVTGPLSETVAGRLYVAARNRDGYYDNATIKDPNNNHFYTGRGQILWRASEAADVNLAVDYTKRHEACCGAVQIRNGATAPLVLALAPGGIANPPNPDALRDYSNRDQTKDIVDYGASAIVNWDTGMLGGARLTSITSARNWKQTGGGDIDWTSADILYSPELNTGGDHGYTQFKTYTQEFRLSGQTDKLNWVAGAFFSKEELTLHVRTVTFGNQFEQYLAGLLGGAGAFQALTGRPIGGGAYAPGQGQNDTYSQDEKGAAVFTNVSYKLTDALEVTGGLRYTWEKKDLDTRWSNTDNATGCAGAVARFPTSALPGYAALCPTSANPRFGQIGTNSQHKKENALTGTAKISYRFTPEVLTYASYAHGYKAGGFNLDRIAPGAQSAGGFGRPAEPVLNTSFAEETVNSYEVGVKNTLLDRSLLLNATVFYQEYKDFQLNAFNGLVFTVASVPKVISKGVDSDFYWFTPVDGLTLNGGVTYAMTYYPTSTPRSLGGNLPGSRLSLAPLWSVSLAGTYEHQISENLMGRVSVNGKYVSSYNTGSDLNPIKNQPGFTLVNGRIGIGPQDKKWQFEVWGQNLTDERYYQVAFDAVFQSGSYDAFLGMPRTYGATVRFTY